MASCELNGLQTQGLDSVGQLSHSLNGDASLTQALLAPSAENSAELLIPEEYIQSLTARVITPNDPEFTQYLNLANTEFYQYYARKPKPGDASGIEYAEPPYELAHGTALDIQKEWNLADKFDRNGQRTGIVLTTSDSTVVAGISVVSAIAADETSDVEEYFEIPKVSREIPHFTIGRLTLNHGLILNNDVGHVQAGLLYQRLHMEAVALIRSRCPNSPRPIFAVVNDKTHAFVEENRVGIERLNSPLLNNGTTQHLVAHYPKYWSNDPHLVRLTEDLLP